MGEIGNISPVCWMTPYFVKVYGNCWDIFNSVTRNIECIISGCYRCNRITPDSRNCVKGDLSIEASVVMSCICLIGEQMSSQIVHRNSIALKLKWPDQYHRLTFNIPFTFIGTVLHWILYAYFTCNIVLFVHVACCHVGCSVLELSAVKMTALSPN